MSSAIESKEVQHRKNSGEFVSVPNTLGGSTPDHDITETLPAAATSTPLLPAGAAGLLKTTAKHAGGRPRTYSGRHSGQPLVGTAKRAAERKRFVDRQAQAAKQVGALSKFTPYS